MVVRRIAVIFLILILAACVRQQPRYFCVPQLYTIQNVEQIYGTPNQIISRHSYTWYGYVTRSPSGYPIKKDFLASDPKNPIAKTVPVTRLHPSTSSSSTGCSVWYEANHRGIIVDVRRFGQCYQPCDWHRTIGN
jgi:hypothetical protein